MQQGPHGMHLAGGTARPGSEAERGFLWDFCSLLFPQGMETPRGLP